MLWGEFFYFIKAFKNEVSLIVFYSSDEDYNIFSKEIREYKYNLLN
jgi:hypothetical protein